MEVNCWVTEISEVRTYTDGHPGSESIRLDARDGKGVVTLFFADWNAPDGKALEAARALCKAADEIVVFLVELAEANAKRAAEADAKRDAERAEALAFPGETFPGESP